MKSYGANKATEFTRKQIGVLYYKAKSNELKVEKWVINRFYDLADYYGYDDNGSVAAEERDILNIIETMFAGNIEETQELINEYTEKIYNLLGNKAKARANREMGA